MVSSHLTSLKMTDLKDVILGRSFGKVLGTLRWSSEFKDVYGFNFIPKKDAKAFASDAS